MLKAKSVASTLARYLPFLLPGLSSMGSKSSPPPYYAAKTARGSSLYYDAASQILSVYPEGQTSYYLTATSGKQNCVGCDASTPNQGPIPSGNYTLNAQDLSNPNAFGDLLRNLPHYGADWGDWRVRLIPDCVKRYFTN